jgi:hypothetical protein
MLLLLHMASAGQWLEIDFAPSCITGNCAIERHFWLEGKWHGGARQ